jgi:hypothetical protein
MTDRVKYRTGMAAGLIAAGLMFCGSSPLQAADNNGSTKQEQANLCLLIGSGCIKVCGEYPADAQEQCIDACIADESRCYKNIRRVSILGTTTVPGGGVATQGVGAVTPGSDVTIQGGTFSAQGN